MRTLLQLKSVIWGSGVEPTAAGPFLRFFEKKIPFQRHLNSILHNFKGI